MSTTAQDAERCSVPVRPGAALASLGTVARAAVAAPQRRIVQGCGGCPWAAACLPCDRIAACWPAKPAPCSRA